MAPEGFKNTGQGSDGGGGGNELIKGLWTPKEDAILVKYVRENGERKWGDLSRKFGLMRCGNSCRLRWFNHLRSNLKKEDFTPEEENKILKLHAEYGNRWSRIAGHLSGRTDNEIKNYWNIRLKRLVRAGLPIYPPEILQEIRDRRSNHKKLKQSPQKLSSFSSSSSSTFQENPNNFNCIPSSHQNTGSIESSSIQENPDLSSINSMSLMEAMSKYPLLIATLYPLVNMSKFNLHSDSNGGVALPPPPSSQHLNFLNSPNTPLFAGSQLAPSNMDILLKDDAFLSENFEIEIPSIQSGLNQAITPTSFSDENDHFIVTSNGEDNYIMDLERNSGLLEDVLRQSTTLLSSQLPYNQSEGRIMHDDSTASMNHPDNSNANLESVFGSSANDMSHVDDSINDIGVISEADVFEILNMLNDDLVDIPSSGPLQELNMRSNGWEDCAQELMGSQIAITPLEQDHDWDLGYMPSFS